MAAFDPAHIHNNQFRITACQAAAQAARKPDQRSSGTDCPWFPMTYLVRLIKFAGLACLLGSLTAPAAAKERRLSYAEELGPLLLLAEPRFDRLQGELRVCEEHARRACPGAKISLIVGEQVRQLVVAADGRVEIPIERELAERGAQLWLQKPDGAPTCQILANVTAKVPAGLEWRYRDLSAFSEQLQAYLNHGAGALSLFAPRLRGLLIRFEAGHAAHLVIHANAGEIALQSTSGELRLPIDKRLLEENPAVSLSTPALSIDGWLDD